MDFTHTFSSGFAVVLGIHYYYGRIVLKSSNSLGISRLKNWTTFSLLGKVISFSFMVVPYSQTLWALVSSDIWYLSSFLAMPDMVARHVNYLLFSFLWKEKCELVARSSLTQPSRLGGLVLMGGLCWPYCRTGPVACPV